MKYSSVISLFLILIKSQAARKELSLGISNIGDLLRKDHLYVDKTGYLLRLLQLGPRHAMITRPGKFGKSLLLSTLDEIFSGNKQLFKGTNIYRSNYNWKRYLVLHYDFSQLDSSRPEKYEDELMSILQKVKKSNKALVVLIDNYDIPIIRNIANFNVAEKIRAITTRFLTALNDPDVKYLFITGVCKFDVRQSFTSTESHIEDISMDPEYTRVMGFTEQELEDNFNDHIRHILEERTRQQGLPVSQKNISDEMRSWYHGYNFSFSQESHPVYHPHSVMCYLKNAKAQNYISKAPDSELFDLASVLRYNATYTAKRTLEEPLDINRLHMKAFMVHHGYLTIRGKHSHPMLEALVVHFPNREIESMVCNAALEACLNRKLSDVEEAVKMKRYLRNLNLDNFIRLINLSLKAAYNAFKYADEEFFQRFFNTKLKSTGLEMHSSLDGCAENSKTIFIFVVSVDRTAKELLAKAGMSKNEFITKKKNILCIGINYLSSSANFDECYEWKANLYFHNGTLSRSLTPKKGN